VTRRVAPQHPPAKASPPAPDVAEAPPELDSTPPPTWRDAWAWLSLVAVVLVIVQVRGAALAEPVLDDILHLRYLILGRHFDLLDGGGVPYYWRPLAKQIYFTLLGPVLITRPTWVAGLHVVALGAMTLLLYRALRATWPGGWAAAAASFAVLHESTRMFVAWPSNFQDLGAMLFGALAVHEVSRRRLPTALAALAASLLCKEVGVVIAVLLPFVPRRGGTTWRERFTIGGGAAATVLVWGALYATAIRHGVLMPKDAPGSEHTFAVPWLVRYAWVLQRTLGGAFNLGVAGAWGPFGGLALVAIGIAAVIVFAASGRARARLRAALPWTAWGALWCLGASATLPAIFPGWASYRGVPATAGLGLAVAGLAGVAHPVLLVGLVAVRAALFMMASPPATVITALPPAADVVIDFPMLSRLQLVLRETRVALQHGVPVPPHGSRVCLHYLPRLAEYAMKGDASLQSWYRDTTLAWVGYSDFRADTTLPIVAVVEYQPEMTPSVALVDPGAMRGLFAATHHLEAGDTPAALGDLDRALAEQRDEGARVFLGTVTSKRAVCLLELGPPDAAERDSARALAIWPDNLDSRYVIASVLAGRGQFTEAEAQLDTLLAANPNDQGAMDLLAKVRMGKRPNE